MQLSFLRISTLINTKKNYLNNLINMKLKHIFLIFCISHFISMTYGCEIKDVSPTFLYPGDTVNINISLDLPDCGLFEDIIIFGEGDTIYALEFTQINDTLLEAEFIIPDTVTVGKALIEIITSEFGGIHSDWILVIGTEMTEAPEICMVTVDSTNKNMIIWEDPNLAYLDSVYIYKETSMTGNYVRIGTQSAEEVTFFIDKISNPDQNSNSYKISFVDTNGYESPLSTRHKTMHLMMNVGVGGACNLIWDSYSGFKYNSFNVYRGTSKNGLIKIAELPTNLFTYTDLAPPLGKVYYVIEVVKPTGCDVGNLKSTNDFYSSAYSNIISTETTSLKDNLSDEFISIFIDETNDILNISVKNRYDKYYISVFSLDGKEKIKKEVFSNTKLNISDLKSGIYIIKINSDKKVFTKKIIKE
jgi:hypothetical protein